MTSLSGTAGIKFCWKKWELVNSKIFRFCIQFTVSFLLLAVAKYHLANICWYNTRAKYYKINLSPWSARDDYRLLARHVQWVETRVRVTKGHRNRHISYIRSATYNLLLMFHSNDGPISYHFGDKRWFQSKIAIISTHPVYFVPPLTGFSLELGIGPRIQ